MMQWNFCPTCGHRIYQHGDANGCEHEDHRELVLCEEEGCTRIDRYSAMVGIEEQISTSGVPHKHPVPVICCCDVKHRELVHA